MNQRAPVTLKGLNEMKSAGENIAMLTAYDYSSAKLLDASGIDSILVGDSLGMVIQGHNSTLPVSLEDIAYHTAAVARGLQSAWLIADIPFLRDHSTQAAAESARVLVGDSGASMVKLEGAGPMISVIEYLAGRDIPVCGHLGLTPQSVHQLSGYNVQGRDAEKAGRIFADAVAIQDAGAGMLVLECVPDSLGQRVSTELDIPVIGIGAGPGCNGQVLVLHDMLGFDSGKKPRFVKNFMDGAASLGSAVSTYVQAVKDGSYPGEQYSYGG